MNDQLEIELVIPSLDSQMTDLRVESYVKRVDRNFLKGPSATTD